MSGGLGARSYLQVVLFYGAIGVNSLLFPVLIDTNYLLWYLSQGSLISLSTALLSTIVNDLDRNTELVSDHPRYYYAGCVWVVALFVSSLRTNFASLLAPISRDTVEHREISQSVFMFLWNVFVGIIVTGLLSLIVVLWFLIVAPFQYVVFLVAGAPVRMGLSGAPLRTILDDESDPDQQTIAVVEDARKPTKNVLDVSFTRKPFTLTSAIAAILLWLTNNALGSFT